MIPPFCLSLFLPPSPLLSSLSPSLVRASSSCEWTEGILVYLLVN